MKITIHGELTDLNTYISKERGNKYGGSTIKKKETGRCVAYFLGTRIRDDVRVHITFNWYLPNARKDPDNIAFAKKFILDGMVTAKFLTNDSFKFISGFEDKFSIDKNNPRIEVEIKKAG
jgi:hypothetical protein